MQKLIQVITTIKATNFEFTAPYSATYKHFYELNDF